MREVKFRAWYEKEKRFLSWDELQDGTESLQTYFNNELSDVSPLMQYTGLKDKNGKEIYEGDVVKYLDGEFSFIAKVAWSDWMWYLEGINPKESFMFDDVADNETADIEIIGNRFEHPHLLEEST